MSDRAGFDFMEQWRANAARIRAAKEAMGYVDRKDLQCCLTCVHHESGYDGESGCLLLGGWRQDGDVEETGLCDRYEKGE